MRRSVGESARAGAGGSEARLAASGLSGDVEGRDEDGAAYVERSRRRK
ncbi:MAG: hypothetical protein WKF43_06525 [Acidimicrobiales bacterium]